MCVDVEISLVVWRLILQFFYKGILQDRYLENVDRIIDFWYACEIYHLPQLLRTYANQLLSYTLFAEKERMLGIKRILKLLKGNLYTTQVAKLLCQVVIRDSHEWAEVTQEEYGSALLGVELRTRAAKNAEIHEGGTHIR